MKTKFISKLYKGVLHFIEDDELQDKVLKIVFKAFAFYFGFQILRFIGNHVVDILIASKYGSDVL